MQIYQDNIAARLAGNSLQPLSGVSITVTDDATNLPASLYSDNGVTPLAQPLTTDDDGYFSFAAADGSYTLTFTSPRIATFTRKVILEDPADDPYATKTELAAVSGAELIGFRRSFDNEVMTVAQALNEATVENADVVRGTLLTGLDLAVNAAITAGDSLLTMAGKLQRQITERVGLTDFKINFRNIADTFTSFLTNANTAARTYTFPDKDGTVAMTSDIPSASAMTLLGSATVGSAVANIDFLSTFSASYDKYIIELHGITASASQTILMQFANAGVVDAGASYTDSQTPGGTLTAGSTFFNTNTASNSISMTITVMNTNGAGRKAVWFDLITATTPRVYGANYTPANTVSGFRLYLAGAANFTGGTLRVYGIKN